MRLLVCNAHWRNANGSPRNNGDAALLHITAQWLRDNGDAVTVTLAHGGTAEPDGVSYRDLGALSAAVRAADAVVVAGGTVLADDQPGSAVRGHPRTLATIAFLARRAHRPLVLLGVGAEPVPPGVKRTLLRYTVSRARSIVARDDRSAGILADLYGAEAVTGGDLYWLRPPTPNPGSSGATVFALRGNDFAELFGTGAVPSGATCLAMDSSDLDGVAVPADVRTVVPHTWTQAHDVIAGADLVVASRMHALYFAAGTGVPAVAIRTTGKVRSFAAEFGLLGYDSAADAVSVDLSSVGAVPADPQAVGDARTRVEKAVREAVSTIGVRLTG